MDIKNTMQTTPTYNPISKEVVNSKSADVTNDKGIMQKDDFLKLFLASLQYQDPMSPMETKDMMAQMTQLSTMEQLTNMSKIMEELKEVTAQQEGVDDGVDFLGKEISGLSSEGQLVEGVVDEVVLNNGVLQLMIGDKSLDLASVSRVADYSKYGVQNPEKITDNAKSSEIT